MSRLSTVLLTDIAFKGDIIVADDGDLALITNQPNMEQALLDRLLTVPGTLLHRPTYGVGIEQYKNAPLTLALKQKIAASIRDQFLQDSRVVSVRSVAFNTTDSYPGQVIISVKAVLQGIGETALTFGPFLGQVAT